MLHWLQKELIGPEAADWIDTCARWAIEDFGQDAFWQHTRLVVPDETDFPEKVTGPEPMARYVLKRVTELSGVAHWPWQLIDTRVASPAAPKLLPIDTEARFPPADLQPLAATTEVALQVPFVIQQTTKPHDLVASIAHTCAQHMLWQSQQTPPGGMDYFEQAAEILAVFQGFGIVLTNSAYTFRGSCASCYNPRANRQASLSEDELVYALALFCSIKNEPTSLIFKHLKPHLKNSFKLALKQIKNRPPLFTG